MRLLLGSTAVVLLAGAVLYGRSELQTNDGLNGQSFQFKQISEWPIWTTGSGKSEQTDSSDISRALQSAMCSGGPHQEAGAGTTSVLSNELSEWPTWPKVSGKIERAARCGGCGKECGRMGRMSASMASDVVGQESFQCGGCGQGGKLVVLERLTEWLVGSPGSEDRERR